MAIFAVLHIFAFPWKVYSIKHNYADPLTAPGSGYSGGVAKYKGGPLGIYALADAANPWDIIKASARGFRWLFVGVRKRELDVSYQNPTKPKGAGAGYMGPTYAGNAEPATELRPSEDIAGGRLRADQDEDDRAGLLRHSGNIAGGNASRNQSASPYRTYTNDPYAAENDSPVDRQHPIDSNAAAAFVDAKPSEFEEDTGYHPGVGPSRVHPALRDQGEQSNDWNHWGGAAAQDNASVAGRPPPSYRTNDPRS